jgi:hypothetical protein
MGEGRVVLQRPWWARILGPNPGTALVIGALGWTLPFAPLLALTGDLAGAGVALAAGGGAWALCALGWRVGVIVDDDAITVQNMVFHHRIPWDGVARLELGDWRGTPAVSVQRHRRGAVEIGAMGFVGQARRLAWVDAVAPILARHGIPIAITPTGTAEWNAIQAPYEGYHGPLRGTGPWWRQVWDRPVTRQDRMLVGALGGGGALLAAVGGLSAWWTGAGWQSPVGLGLFAIGVAVLHIGPMLLVRRLTARSDGRAASS